MLRAGSALRWPGPATPRPDPAPLPTPRSSSLIESQFGGGAPTVPTGDIAVIHPDNSLRLTDRAKDVIKSGGEWISSIELENAAVGCPGVAEAAAIGIPHPKWDERPLLLVVRANGCEVGEAEIREHLSRRIAKWWLPDAILFVDELPHTATGKLSKKDLRDQYRDYRFPTAEAMVGRD